MRKKKTGNLGKKIGLLRRSVGNPHHGVDLHHSVGCPRRGEVGGQNGTHQVRHGVATIHDEQILDFCFRTPRIRTPIV